MDLDVSRTAALCTPGRTAGPNGKPVVRRDPPHPYDRKTPFGKLDRGLEEAPKRGRVVAGTKDDWKTVFPARKPK